jgi:hypothetical protein
MLIVSDTPNDSAKELEKTQIVTDAKSQISNTKSVQMRTVVFQMLHDILCDEVNGSKYVNKFATTITNKWLLLFFERDSDPLSAVLAARIFAKIYSVRGSSFIQSFKSANGFIVLKKLSPTYWNVTQLHEILLLTALGVDASIYPFYEDFNIKHLRDYLEDIHSDFKMIVPDLIPVLFAMWDEGVQQNGSHIVETFIQLFSEIYDSVYLLKEAYNKQETVDSVVQILFTYLSSLPLSTTEEELGSKDTALINFDSDYLSSSASSRTSSASGFPDRFSKSMDDDTTSVESMSTVGSNILKRGGSSVLTTKTSPHVQKRINTVIGSLK